MRTNWNLDISVTQNQLTIYCQEPGNILVAYTSSTVTMSFFWERQCNESLKFECCTIKKHEHF